jgi:small-conductance mechanosensitive channel
MQQFLGITATDADIAKYAMNAAGCEQTMKYTDDDFKENFQYYMGRQASTGELAQMKRANITNFNQMRNFLQQQPAYLKNLNTVAQQAYQAEQKSAEEALAEQARLASSLTPEQVSTAYKDTSSRPPTMDELKQYMGAQQTQEGLAGSLKGSQEYLGKLTQPFIPTPTPTVCQDLFLNTRQRNKRLLDWVLLHPALSQRLQDCRLH